MSRYVTTPRLMGSCNIVKTNKGKYINETLPYMNNFLSYLKVNMGVTFKEFVCDFILDE